MSTDGTAFDLATENRRLLQIAQDMRAEGFPLLAGDVRKLSVKAGTMAVWRSFYQEFRFARLTRLRPLRHAIRVVLADAKVRYVMATMTAAEAARACNEAGIGTAVPDSCEEAR